MDYLQRFVRDHKGLLTLGLALILTSLLHPTYFMADDWERIYAQISQNTANFFRAYYLRIFIQGLSTEYIFPVFFLETFRFSPPPAHTVATTFSFISLFWGKFILWGCLLSSVWFYLIPFRFFSSDGQSLNGMIKKHFLWGLLPLAMAFNPNNYEWIFFPTVMTLLPTLFLMAAIFYLTHTGKITPVKIFGNTLAILLGFYAYESLLPFSFLMEIAFFLYSENHSQDPYRRRIRNILAATVPALVIAVISKYFFYKHQMAVNGRLQSYDVSFGLKGHLLTQLLSLTLGHDYYKIRWATGPAAFLGILLVVVGRIKTTLKEGKIRDFWQKDLVMILAYMVGTSYYYMYMNYSGRRALGGPLFFSWAFIFVSYVHLLLHPYLTQRFKHCMTFFIIIPFLLHHMYIFREKERDRRAFFKITRETKERIKLMKESEKFVTVSMEESRAQLGRGWHMVNPIQLHGMLAFHLAPEEYSKVLPLRVQYPYLPFIYEVK